MLYAGGGVVHAEAADELTALARLAELPVTTTLMALGAFPASDQRWLGMLGMHGTRAANWAMDEADLIIAVGARFDDRVTGDARRRSRRGRRSCTSTSTRRRSARTSRRTSRSWATRGQALDGLARDLDALAPGPGRLRQWWGRIAAGATRIRRRDGAARAARSTPRRRSTRCAAIGGDAIVTTDVGQHQMWAANRLRFDRPRRWLTSGGLGTMGFGLPAALGAQAAFPAAQSCASPATARCS